MTEFVFLILLVATLPYAAPQGSIRCKRFFSCFLDNNSRSAYWSSWVRYDICTHVRPVRRRMCSLASGETLA